jgi:hypothetical protein
MDAPAKCVLPFSAQPAERGPEAKGTHPDGRGACPLCALFPGSIVACLGIVVPLPGKSETLPEGAGKAEFARIFRSVSWRRHCGQDMVFQGAQATAGEFALESPIFDGSVRQGASRAAFLPYAVIL